MVHCHVSFISLSSATKTNVKFSTTAKGQTGHFSEMVDSTFDAAYNATVNEDDLKNVRWGRIDYLEVTALTTKWGIWQ
jgi:hypothetical protein